MSLLKTKVLPTIAEGCYTAKIKDFQESTQGKANYIVITLEIEDTLLGITRDERDCVFEVRIPYIASALQKQWDKDFEDFGALLEFGKTHEFAVKATNHVDYGIQFNYRG